MKLTEQDYGKVKLKLYIRHIFFYSTVRMKRKIQAREMAKQLSTSEKLLAVKYIKERFPDLVGVDPAKIAKRTAQRERAISIITSTL